MRFSDVDEICEQKRADAEDDGCAVEGRHFKIANGGQPRESESACFYYNAAVGDAGVCGVKGCECDRQLPQPHLDMCRDTRCRAKLPAAVVAHDTASAAQALSSFRVPASTTDEWIADGLQLKGNRGPV